jgi:heterodisulfide reductase subunit A
MNHNGNGHPGGTPKAKIGVYVCDCGINIVSKVDVPAVVAFARSLPGVTISREYKFMCSDPGQELIQKDIREGLVDRVVVASCSPLMHEVTFRNALNSAELNPFFFQMSNIREHVSWVTEGKADATEKAKALVAGAVRRVAFHEALEKTRFPVNSDVLVVGGGIAGIHAALVLAESGKKVWLVEREPTIGGHMAKFDKTFPTLDCSACILTPKMTQVRAHPNIEMLTYSEVAEIGGYVGNFQVKVRRKSRYVDEQLCNGCGECEKICPVEHPSEFDEGMSKRHAIFRSFPQAVPNTFTISRLGMPPCQASCFLHQNVQGYTTLIAHGKFREAVDVILRDNPLPSVCGRICTHPCTISCSRGKVGEPLNIPALKRAAVDWVIANDGGYSLKKPASERPEKVAIVGSGPAGLMCAYHLRQLGYQTEIFEALAEPGGMLAVGIPEFRLPKAVLRSEISKFRDIGVVINTGKPIGKNGISIEDLRKRYQAVFIGIGAHVEKKMKIPGEDIGQVWGGVEFLRRVNLGSHPKLTGKVVVVGGGNSALDAARTALRLGADEVLIAYRRTRAEMPADPAEVEAAEQEGVKIEFLVAPTRIHGTSKVEKIELQRMKLGPPDESGRPRPIPEKGTEFTLASDYVIATIGQVPDLSSLGERLEIDTTHWGTIEADPVTLQTNIPGVFAGGDCVSGPDVVVTALGAGKRAAISIDRFLNAQNLHMDRELEGSFESWIELDTEGLPVRKMVPMPALAVAERRSFKEVHTGYTSEMAIEEAKRCLDCAVCCDCQLCATVCEPKAIDYKMKDQFLDLNVGAVVLATGFKAFHGGRTTQYGYGRYPNVFTSLEIERMVNASGPTGGVVVLRDGITTPKRVGIVHCVGSRDEHANKWCSKVCCMYSLKLAHLIKERTGAEMYNFYIDMRTPGKGYEEFYDKLLHENVHFIRGRAAEVTDWALSTEEVGKLVIRAEDTLLGMVRRVAVDMVVLAVGLEPQPDHEDVRRLFNISCSKEGWFLERHPKLAPVSTFTDGIFLAGACQGPKDIPDSVAQAGAAAAEAMALIDRGYVEMEPNTAFIDEEVCSGCRLCAALCPFSAIGFDNGKYISTINAALCKGCGTCVASCPSGAASQHLFTDDQLFAEISGVMSYV